MRTALGVWFPSLVPFAMTFPAVLASTLLCGRYAGLICVAITQIGAWYMFVPQRFSFSIASPSDTAGLIISTLSALLIVGFADRHIKIVASVKALERGEAERSLEAQTAESDRLQRIFDQAPAIIAMLEGPEHRFTLSNKAHQRLVGRNDVVGLTIREAEPGLESQGVYALLVGVFSSGIPHAAHGVQIRYEREAGSIDERRLDFIYQPVFDFAGAITGVFSLSTDVTERFDSLRRLADSEARFRAAVNAVSGVLWTTSPEGETTGDQPGWAALTGQTAEDYQGYGWSDSVHRDDRQATIEASNEAVAGGDTFNFEHRLRVADGSWRSFSIRAIPVFGESGEIHEWVGVHSDITDRRLAETRLKDLNGALESRIAAAVSESRLLADLVEGTDAAVLVIDNDHRLIGVNPAALIGFERLYGLKPHVGDHSLALFDDWPEDRAKVQAAWERALSGQAHSVIAEFGDPNHRKRLFEVRYDVLRNQEGDQIGAYQFGYDVTERISDQRRLASAEEQLRQSQKMEAMGQLTGGVAHDINNLLTPIMGTLDMLQRMGVGGERERRLIEGALQSAERARTLVERLLAIARRQPLQPTAVDVGAVVSGMAELMASTTGPQIKVLVDLESDLPPAHADANQVAERVGECTRCDLG